MRLKILLHKKTPESIIIQFNSTNQPTNKSFFSLIKKNRLIYYYLLFRKKSSHLRLLFHFKVKTVKFIRDRQTSVLRNPPSSTSLSSSLSLSLS